MLWSKGPTKYSMQYCYPQGYLDKSPPLTVHFFTWFNGYHHAWLEGERSGYIWGIMNIHAEIMAHMMRAVLSNSLAEDKTSVTEVVKHRPTHCSDAKDWRGERAEFCA